MTNHDLNISIHRHRDVDIVIMMRSTGKWCAKWKFPGEDDAVSIYRDSESLALGGAKNQIDRCIDGARLPEQDKCFVAERTHGQASKSKTV